MTDDDRATVCPQSFSVEVFENRRGLWCAVISGGGFDRLEIHGEPDVGAMLAQVATLLDGRSKGLAREQGTERERYQWKTRHFPRVRRAV